jgi:hypothetical protein
MSQKNVDVVRAGWEEFNTTGHSPVHLPEQQNPRREGFC